MICPKCGNEMEKGALYSPSRGIGTIWCPEKQINSKSIKKQQFALLFKTWKTVIEENDLVVLKAPSSVGYDFTYRLFGSYVPSWICRNCKCGFYDYSDTAPEEEEV